MNIDLSGHDPLSRIIRYVLRLGARNKNSHQKDRKEGGDRHGCCLTDSRESGGVISRVAEAGNLTFLWLERDNDG